MLGLTGAIPLVEARRLAIFTRNQRIGLASGPPT
jgi:hypothetical protein